MNYLDKYNFWCTDSIFDSETKNELLEIKNNPEEIKDRFYQDLEFGTAGLRGVIGAGTNRMNRYTVGKAAQGLANYIKIEKTESKGVAIAYDSRHMSKEFSELTALCLNANGIKTYLFDYPKPTPELSFAVRQFNCTAGIVITASHNPPEYNGFKVYWDDGAQISTPNDTKIIAEVSKITDYSLISSMDKQTAIDTGLFNIIDETFDTKYINTLKNYSLNPELIKEFSKDLRIVYTPLHGTGGIIVKRLLAELEFTNVFIVKEEELPNPDFPNMDYPNPEDINAFNLALKLGKEKNADIILANDPDADRLGILVKNYKTNEYEAFNGNMTAMLIAEYMLSQKKIQNTIPKNGALISTIVSTHLAKAIAKNYDLTFFETLTGFKHMGKLIRDFERDNSYEYQFGFEESYGCLIGTHARDKDGIVAIMFLCEAATYYRSKGLSLIDQMNAIYEKYGYFLEGQKSITLKGLEGSIKIKEMLNNIRNTPPTKIGEFKVLSVRDYQNNTITNTSDNTVTTTGLPNSNVIYFELDNNAWCCLRPSGTEPKLKIYAGVKSDSANQSKEQLSNLIDSTIKLLNK